MDDSGLGFRPSGSSFRTLTHFITFLKYCFCDVPKIGQPSHDCVIEVISSDSELEEDTDHILAK
jgi:hypothetical protein